MKKNCILQVRQFSQGSSTSCIFAGFFIPANHTPGMTIGFLGTSPCEIVANYRSSGAFLCP